ncbi:MAG: hypothetical protein AAFW69_00170 [Pseudomonadota bacterium]
MTRKPGRLALATICCSLAMATAAVAHPRPYVHSHVVVVPAPRAVVVPAPRVVVAPRPRVRPAARGCAIYGCSGEVTRTGPYGNSVTATGTAGCADGTCSRSRTVTGSGGGSATFNRSISR